MPDYSLDISEFLQQCKRMPVMDVRSPGEFLQGHMPGAVSLPLFTNEERSVIGKLYLQQGSTEAVAKALEMIRPKFKQLADAAYTFAPGGESLMYCWRGGMRSNSMAWLLNTAGISTATLRGGYKSFRRFAHVFFEKPFNLLVIGGMTGSGKTEVIESLEDKGYQVIHLERLASHKGSVFGAIGMNPQPSTEQFENALFMQLWQLDPNQPVFIEDESLSIGKVFIPRPFFDQLSSAPLVKLVVPMEHRIMRLVKQYTHGNAEQLTVAVQHIEKRMGTENARAVIELIRSNNMTAAVERILKYYDKLYTRSMQQHQRTGNYELEFSTGPVSVIADKIADIAFGRSTNAAGYFNIKKPVEREFK